MRVLLLALTIVLSQNQIRASNDQEPGENPKPSSSNAQSEETQKNPSFNVNKWNKNNIGVIIYFSPSSGNTINLVYFYRLLNKFGFFISNYGSKNISINEQSFSNISLDFQDTLKRILDFISRQYAVVAVARDLSLQGEDKKKYREILRTVKKVLENGSLALPNVHLKLEENPDPSSSTVQSEKTQENLSFNVKSICDAYQDKGVNIDAILYFSPSSNPLVDLAGFYNLLNEFEYKSKNSSTTISPDFQNTLKKITELTSKRSYAVAIARDLSLQGEDKKKYREILRTVKELLKNKSLTPPNISLIQASESQEPAQEPSPSSSTTQSESG